MDRALRFARGLYDAIEYVAIGAYVALFVLINVQVFWRYVLNNPLSWPEEVARALFIWISYLGLIKVVREQSSYRIDFLAMRMPGPLRLAVATVVDLVTLTFFVAVIAHAGLVIRSNWSMTTSIPMPINVIYLSLPVAIVFILPLLVVLIVRRLGCLVRGEDEPGPGATVP